MTRFCCALGTLPHSTRTFSTTRTSTTALSPPLFAKLHPVHHLLLQELFVLSPITYILLSKSHYLDAIPRLYHHVPFTLPLFYPLWFSPSDSPAIGQIPQRKLDALTHVRSLYFPTEALRTLTYISHLPTMYPAILPGVRTVHVGGEIGAVPAGKLFVADEVRNAFGDLARFIENRGFTLSDLHGVPGSRRADACGAGGAIGGGVVGWGDGEVEERGVREVVWHMEEQAGEGVALRIEQRALSLGATVASVVIGEDGLRDIPWLARLNTPTSWAGGELLRVVFQVDEAMEERMVVTALVTMIKFSSGRYTAMEKASRTYPMPLVRVEYHVPRAGALQALVLNEVVEEELRAWVDKWCTFVELDHCALGF
ncbi:hypothetical protein IAT38_001027 [Cryptococcus sp. DSM 104549]